MIDQFTDGVNSYSGLWKTINCYWRVFTHKDKPLMRPQFKDLYCVQWSEVGANKMDAEEDTMYAFESLLNTVEGVCTYPTYLTL